MKLEPRIIPSEISEAAYAYGRNCGVSGALDSNDFIFWYIHDAHGGLNAPSIVEEYFRSGMQTAQLLKGLLDEARLSAIAAQRPVTEKPLSILEFASGYGRVTRHFSTIIPNAEVVACDIHTQAVSFLSNIGLKACRSSRNPDEFDLGRTFGVIFAFSFFTHVPRSTWRPWLLALTRHLSDNGMLIFTTHGEVSQGLMGVPGLDADGFFFIRASEQKDLDVAEYGNTVTTFEYVYSQIVGTGLKLLEFKQAGAGHQDVYVLHRKLDSIHYPVRRDANSQAGREQQLVALIDALEDSTSWKVTAPLRKLSRAFSRLRSKAKISGLWNG